MNISFEFNNLSHQNFEIDEAIALGVPTDVIKAAIDTQIYSLARADVNAIADGAYTRNVSRAARYEQKLFEAKAYKAAGYPMPVDTAVYVYMQGEAEARGITPTQHADAIIAASTAFNVFGGMAELALVKCKTVVIAIPLGADIPAAISLKQAAADAVVAEIKAFTSLLA